VKKLALQIPTSVSLRHGLIHSVHNKFTIHDSSDIVFYGFNTKHTNLW